MAWLVLFCFWCILNTSRLRTADCGLRTADCGIHMGEEGLPPFSVVWDLATEKKDPQANLLLAKYYLDGEQIQTSIQFFTEAAYGGSSEAAQLLAQLYR